MNLEHCSFADLRQMAADNFSRFDQTGQWREEDQMEEHLLHLAILEKAVGGDPEAWEHINTHWDDPPSPAELAAFLAEQRKQLQLS